MRKGRSRGQNRAGKENLIPLKTRLAGKDSDIGVHHACDRMGISI